MAKQAHRSARPRRRRCGKDPRPAGWPSPREHGARRRPRCLCARHGAVQPSASTPLATGPPPPRDPPMPPASHASASAAALPGCSARGGRASRSLQQAAIADANGTRAACTVTATHGGGCPPTRASARQLARGRQLAAAPAVTMAVVHEPAAALVAAGSLEGFLLHQGWRTMARPPPRPLTLPLPAPHAALSARSAPPSPAAPRVAPLQTSRTSSWW